MAVASSWMPSGHQLMRCGCQSVLPTYLCHCKSICSGHTEIGLPVQACDLADCDVYSYRLDGNEDVDVDPISESSAIWSFTYFFYNRRLKRIVFFSCRSLSTLAVQRAFTPGASSTPTASQDTAAQATAGRRHTTLEPESDSEIVGGMDDL
jgi:hypothetical protein